MKSHLSVFQYDDYRVFIRDRFEAEKSRNPKFSHRMLSNKLGLSTSNFILLVMQGKRNLAPETAFKLAEVFKLNAAETECFETLVRFNQSTVPRDKDRHYQKLLNYRKECRIDRIADNQYEYYSQWYHPVVRELAIDPALKGEPRLIAARLFPSVGIREVKASLKLLLKLGFLKRQDSRYVQASPVISTGPEVVSTAVAKFHRTMAGLAAEAIDAFPRDKRNLSACTVRISEEGYTKIVQALADCRKTVLAIAAADTGPDRVCQLNLQLFPLIKTTAKGTAL